MKSLTGLDATFLYLETPEMPMHVGSLNLCELPAGFKGSFHKAVQHHIASRMHLAPVFSRKLVFMPFDLGHPLWVEAESVDIEFHIRRVPCSAKKPMTLAQAHTTVAQLHSELIDRAHPLWEFYVFDAIKLPSGQVVGGFFSKIHHAALDGKGGVMLANAMLDVGPVPREVPPPDPARRGKTAADLKVGKMIGSVFSNSMAQVAKLAKSLPAAAGTLGSTLAKQSLQGAGGRPKMPMKLAPKTPFNTSIAQSRVFVAATIPLAECKAMGKAVGGSFNDVALWICSTALRSYLANHGGVPTKSMVAAMPVSLREAGASDAANLGNQVSMTLVELGTHLAHPLKRMNAIMASTAKVKTSMQSLKGLLPTDYPSLLAPWLVGGAAKAALNAYGKTGLASRLPMVANLAISNVPGPPVALYLAGAKIVSFHPLSIVLHGLALNITIQTYAGHVDFGIVAGKKALPHAQDLARAIEAAFKEAQALLGDSTVDAASLRKPTASVKTRKAAVAKETPLEKSLSKKKVTRPNTGAVANNTKKSNVSNHGTTRAKAVKNETAKKPSARQARRPAAQRVAAGA
ncbi:MAG TPA: wax ester/triacylglycerol synthase family O-acyltransferase [Polaromonas sp.]|uniref:wax ester/triacylglycerol synthase family O-acyltransferase n=1 Tax=Polaromonas sp. TaxID=1869339 RepID=UPI002D46AC39|nr:wax ester/triacylglycerol synthase family O-acyltransferase [Polaromonas sp.]HYW57799.1 wax ester/triacylglycerol synthase family O-acyltransferase [Polaromonas sp.]